MPPWDAHVAVSKNIFGISEDIVEDINKTIDKGMVHDLGRRMPASCMNLSVRRPLEPGRRNPSQQNRP